MKIVMVYAAGAMLAIMLNLLAQEVTLAAVPATGLELFASVLAGTVSGLIFKYVWDKVFIFGFRAGSAARDLRTFAAYSMTGVVTTAIFWAFEFGFDALFQTKEMRYLGAVIGLVIGYVIKYRLDRRLVFAGAASL
jgi:putative flippase GtrA